ncbi:MAG: bifunctional folylpolyglutamate synthase/dihydrofolate synthase [Lachnospiraceae bacterium]|nr:bifunctional folylpolyglutamate synthase/dihydrofolate synthase [Lachnospiraceae bacterium]
MNAKEAISYIENFTWSTTKLGLERTSELLSMLGDPQKKLKFVHVTGSNGKGSTCAILDSILRKAGYRVGLYTSPYLVRFNERIKVNGHEIPDDTLASITSQVRAFADIMYDHPSQFELVTAIAMEYFYEMQCDIVILEVGMGGALDSTNVIDAPEVAVFTNIGLEHTEYLGKTIKEIAATKGGIIKTGCDCVAYDGPAEATSTLRDICVEKDVPFLLVDFSAAEPVTHSLDGQTLLYKGRVLSFPLLGKHQIRNLCVALETVHVLKKRGWCIPTHAIEEGVAHVSWPARFQVLSTDPLFILDGGHNPQCAEAMADILEDYLPGKKVTFIMGVLADKDYNSMLDSVCPHAARFICLTPESPRALSAASLAEVIRERGFETEVCDSVAEAYDKAKEKTEPIVAFGSLYMSGAVLRYFDNRH